jgi:hypothetical protein
MNTLTNQGSAIANNNKMPPYNESEFHSRSFHSIAIECIFVSQLFVFELGLGKSTAELALYPDQSVSASSPARFWVILTSVALSCLPLVTMVVVSLARR